MPRIYRISLSACLLLGPAALFGCGGSSSSSAAPSNPVSSVPYISALSPASLPSGSPATTLSITGTNLASVTQVYLGPKIKTPSSQSNTAIQIPLTPADLQYALQYAVQVYTGSSSSNTMTFTVTDSGSLPTPVLTAISPAYGTQNAPDTLITLHGSNFVPVSTVYLNSLQLSATYVNSTTITATIPASTLATPGSYPIYVNTEGPGGGNSYQFSFFVLPASGNGVSAFPVMANHVAWDPVRQLLYLSVSGASQTNPDSIQILDPIAGKLGGTVSIANEPDLLALSTTGKYLYVGLDNAPDIQRLVLPSLSPDITIPLGTRDGGSPNYAEDIQPSPVADNTVAVVRGIYEDFGQEWGGVVVYDDAAPRPLQVCGFYNTCGSLPNDATMSSVQWNSTADRLFGANDQNTEYNYSVSPVTASGIGATTVDIDNLLPGFGTKIYYDPITGYVISETGIVLQAATGVVVGHLPVPTGNIEYSISMAVDPTLGRVYAVYQTAAQAAGQDRTLDVYDGHNFTLISRNVLHNIAGSPQHLIRWGTNGLAFVAQVTGYSNVIPNGTVYLLTGDFINK